MTSSSAEENEIIQIFCIPELMSYTKHFYYLFLLSSKNKKKIVKIKILKTFIYIRSLKHFHYSCVCQRGWGFGFYNENVCAIKGRGDLRWRSMRTAISIRTEFVVDVQTHSEQVLCSFVPILFEVFSRVLIFSFSSIHQLSVSYPLFLSYLFQFWQKQQKQNTPFDFVILTRYLIKNTRAVFPLLISFFFKISFFESRSFFNLHVFPPKSFFFLIDDDDDRVWECETTRVTIGHFSTHQKVI